MALTEGWRLEMSQEADKDFGRLGKPVKKRIISFFEERVLAASSPRLFGKALTGRWAGYWSYRVGDYRIIAHIQDHRLTIVAVAIDHRRQVYDS